MTITVYHGSGVSIDAFCYSFTEAGNDALGSGFYFSTSQSEAWGYCFATQDGLQKHGGDTAPTVHTAEVNIQNPMDFQHEMAFALKDVLTILNASPILEKQIEEGWGEIAYSGLENLVLEAAKQYADDVPLPAMRVLNQMSADFFPGHQEVFFNTIRDIYGFDGVLAKYEHAHHYVAWFPDQVTIIHLERAIPESRVTPDIDISDTTNRPSRSL